MSAPEIEISPETLVPAPALVPEPAAADYPPEVRVLELEGRRIVLVGTAHVSRASVDLVHEVIERERPDRVCVELDPRRFEALQKETSWDSLDLRQIIQQKQLATLMLNLLLSSYQKKLGQELGVMPGSELLEATKVAEKLGVPVELCDRDVRVTLRRAIAATPFWKRMWIMSELLASMFEKPQITEKELAELRQGDTLSDLMAELGKQHPDLKRVLIDERDTFLAQKIRAAQGQKLVAVVGAGHLPGIEAALKSAQDVDLEAISVVPPVKKIWHVLGWSVPILILGSLGWIGFQDGWQEAQANLIIWALAASIPASLGAILALSHPLTILAAFVSAPICVLSPVLGTAYVTALVQAWFEPPRVAELHSVADQIGSFKSWWTNRLLRVFMAYILPGIGAMIGSILGFGKLASAIF